MKTSNVRHIEPRRGHIAGCCHLANLLVTCQRQVCVDCESDITTVVDVTVQSQCC